MRHYRNVGPHAVPTPTKTIGVGHLVELPEDEAGPWVELGFLVELQPVPVVEDKPPEPEAQPPAPKKAAPSKES